MRELTPQEEQLKLAAEEIQKMKAIREQAESDTYRKLKAKGIEWIINHPDVFHKKETWWFVQNLIGDLEIMSWEELLETEKMMKSKQ